MSRCTVTAAGVRAEWVEAATASIGQPTLLYLHRCGPGISSDERASVVAQKLAMATSARVLRVGCREFADQPAAEDGVAVYASLLGEGLDLPTTAFVGDRFDLPVAVLLAADDRGLPLPRAVMFLLDTSVRARQ